MSHLTDAELTWTIQRQQERVPVTYQCGSPKLEVDLESSLLAALLELKSRRRRDSQQQERGKQSSTQPAPTYCTPGTSHSFNPEHRGCLGCDPPEPPL